MDRRVMELSEEIGSSTDQRGESDRDDPSFKGMEEEKPPRRIDASDLEAASGDGSQPDDNASKQHDNVLLKTNSNNIARSNNRPPTDSNHNTCKLFQSKLLSRGAVEGLLDDSTGDDTRKFLRLADLVHETPDKVVDFLLSESKEGKFRRHIIHEDDDDSCSRRILYWQHYGSGNKFVEYLLDMRVKCNTTDDLNNYTIDINSITNEDNNDLPEEAVSKLAEILGSTRKAKRGKIGMGLMTVAEMDHGQAAVVFVGTLLSEERKTDIVSSSNSSSKPSNVLKRATKALVGTPSSGVKGFFSIKSLGSTISGESVKEVFNSFKEVFKEVGRQFRQPDVIDKRRRLHFIEHIIPNAPLLTRQEEEMLEGRVKHLEYSAGAAKRQQETLKEDVEKFVFVPKDASNALGISYCHIDVSARALFAYLVEVGTYESAREHKEKNGEMPQKLWYNIDGTRSQQMSTIRKLPASLGVRKFENWRCWKISTSKEGTTSYTLAFVPLNMWEGTKQRLPGLGNKKIEEGETFGVYICTEIAPNVCSLLRIQYVDAKFSLPPSIMNILQKKQMRKANGIQEMFTRNGKKVDKEVREVLMERMTRRSELNDAQQKVFENLKELLGKDNGADWQGIQSPYEGVTMEVKYKKQKNGKTKIVVGRAQGVADCSAEEAAAWFFEYCSRERITQSRVEGHPARLEIRKVEGETNEKFFATVKKLPFPLAWRESTFKHIWKKNTDGSISVGILGVEGAVDYGGRLGRVVRASIDGIFTATNTKQNKREGSVPQCKIHLIQRIDAGGLIPQTIVTRQVPQILGVINEIMNSFDRSDDIDRADMINIANIIKNEHQDYTEEDEGAILKGIAFARIAFLATKNSSDHNFCNGKIRLNLTYGNDDKTCVGVGSTCIDASVDECAAYEFISTTTRRSKREAKRQGILSVKSKQINDHTLYYFTERKIGPGFAIRASRSKLIWKKNTNGTVNFFVQDTNELKEQFPLKPGRILVSIQAVWTFKPLEPAGGVPQTEVTLTAQINLNGTVPSLVFERLAIQFGRDSLSRLHREFDRSIQIDRHRRQELCKKMIRLQKDETGACKHELKYMQGAIQASQSLAPTWIKLRKKKGWGKSVVTIRGELEDVAAFFWDVKSRAKEIAGGAYLLEEEYGERKREDFNVLVREEIAQKHILKRERELVSEMILKKINENEMVLRLKSLRVHENENNTSSVWGLLGLSTSLGIKNTRGSILKTLKKATFVEFKKIGDKETKVELVTKLELDGLTSKGISKAILAKELGLVEDAAFYFNKILKAEEMENGDGEVIAEHLMKRLKERESGKTKEVAVMEFIQENCAMQMISNKYQFWGPLVCALVNNKLQSLAKVKCKAKCATKEEGKLIGRSLALSLATNMNASNGVDEWVLQFPALQELENEFSWIRSFFVQVGFHLMGDGRWGVKARVAMGAVTSITDLLTDVYVTHAFWKAGNRQGLFQASLASLSASIALQLLVVYVQNKKLGVKRLLREWIPIFFGFKPAVDAYRVGKGKGIKEGTRELEAAARIKCFSRGQL